MKKLAIIILCGAFGFANAQNTVSSPTLTSGGNLSGTGGTSSAYYGKGAGSLSSGIANTFIGHGSGSPITTGSYNTFTGEGTGIAYSNPALVVGTAITGSNNSFYGFRSGYSNGNGKENTFVGSISGLNNSSGLNNTFIGFNSGFTNGTGSGNICIGSNSGLNGTKTPPQINNQLYIDNSKNTTPLIWGDFALDQLKLNGVVGIGGVSTFPTMAGVVNVSTYKLFVNGGILTEEVRVALGTTWADYIFAKDYKLPTLAEVEKQIAEKGHLANVPSAAEVKANGIEVGEMAKIQMAKIEELTLYIIQQSKEIELLKSQMKTLLAK